MLKAERWRDGLGAYQVLGYIWTDQCEERLKSGTMVEAAMRRLCLEVMLTWSRGWEQRMWHCWCWWRMRSRNRSALQALDIRLQQNTPSEGGVAQVCSSPELGQPSLQSNTVMIQDPDMSLDVCAVLLPHLLRVTGELYWFNIHLPCYWAPAIMDHVEGMHWYTRETPLGSIHN